MSRVALHHLGKELSNDPPVAFSIYHHDFTCQFLVHIEDKFSLHETSIVNEYIYRSISLASLLGNLSDCLTIRDIELEDLHVLGLGLSLYHILGSLTALLVNIDDGKFGTQFCELNSDKSTQT